MEKINVGIIGSGNIGTDLLIKILRSEYLNCSIFIGRNLSSAGMKKASDLGVKISDKSINAIIENPKCCDVIFDATTASFHKQHSIIFKKYGIKAIDMTPSQVGQICVPAINLKESINAENINMITCGGQASIPLAYVLKNLISNIDYIETVSSISSRSAGPGTRANLDEYIHNTEMGLRTLTGCQNVKAILNLNPAIPCIDMQTTVFAKVDNCNNLDEIKMAINEMEKEIQKYVPGYNVVVPPVFENGRIMIMVRVQGLGDYLPSYAGNLDIINCAAIRMAEEYAKNL